MLIFVSMKYLLRSLKYFLFLLVMFALLLAVLVFAKIVEADISVMFVHGYDSLWQIALMFLGVSLIYPRFGYSKRGVRMPGETSELRPAVLEVMTARGYKLVREDADTFFFIKRQPLDRLFRVYEDGINFTRTAIGYEIEGRTKDVVRLVGALEAAASRM